MFPALLLNACNERLVLAETEPGDADSFTPFRPYLAHFFSVFSRFLRVFTGSPRRFQRAASRNPGPRNPGPRNSRHGCPNSRKGNTELTTRNRRLRAAHATLIEKTIALFSVDLVRQRDQWKEGLREMRAVVDKLTSDGFRNNEIWCAFVDKQVYKALDHQYSLGLESLNEVGLTLF